MSFKLALQYFFKQNKKTYALLSSVVLAVVLIFSMKVIRTSGFDSQIKEYIALNGSYNIFMNNVDENIISEIGKDKDVNRIFYTKNFCSGIEKNSGVKVKIGSFDKDYIYGLKYKFFGKAPKENNEIVIEKEALLQTGLKEYINSNSKSLIGKNINLMLINNINNSGINNLYSDNKIFKIVGIIEKPDKYYLQHRNSISGIEAKAYVMDNSSIPIKSINKYDGIIYLKNNNVNEFLGKKKQELNLKDDLIYENIEYSYIKSLKEHPTIKSDDLKSTILLIIVSSLVIYNIFSIILNEMVSEIGMLRSLGMNKKDIIKMLFFYSILYIVIGTLLGIVLGIVVSYLSLKIVYEYNSVLSIGLDNILYSFLIPIISISISSIILFSKILKLSIVESIKDSDTYIPRKNKFKQRCNILFKIVKVNIFRDKVKIITTLLAMTLVSSMFIVSLSQ